VLAVGPALALAAETAPPPLQNAPAVSATSAPPAAAPSATAAASAVAADGSGTLDAALQRVLKPHCADDTAALRSAALQADPRERAFLARIVRLCDALQAQDGERQEPEEGVDRSGRARLVVGATGYGLWSGIAADVLLEIDDARTSVVPPLVGVGVGLGASLLATSEGEITRGQAWTVITGLDYGTYSGFLLAGAAEWDEAKQIVGVALGSGLLGGAIGSGVAHYLRPTAGDAEVVRSGGLWGFASAGLLAAAIDPDDEQQLLGIMLAGMDGGLLTGALLADRYAISRSRMLLGDTGALAGGVAGLGVGILAVGGPTGDEGRVVAIASLIGLHAGLGLSLYLTRDMEEEGEERDDEQARGAHEPPAALYVHDSAGDWRPGRLAIQPALDATRAGVRPVGAWLPLLGGYW
jgi:hypothetical protein